MSEAIINNHTSEMCPFLDTFQKEPHPMLIVL